MRRAAVIGAILVGGCSFTPGVLPATDPDARRADSASDGTLIDTPSIDGCVASTYVDQCSLSTGTGLTLSGGIYTYDTESDELRSPQNALVPHTSVVQTNRDPDLRVIVVTDLLIDDTATLIASGDFPLAIVASGSITIEGELDVGSSGTTRGAGAPTTCAINPGPGENDSGGAAGGGGGGFGAAGGAGGNGDANGGQSDGGTAGPPMTLPTNLRGGCPGANGGTGVDPGGAGGAGGGAVLLYAHGTLAIAAGGLVRAGGGGGGGGLYLNSGDGDGGGGGGGSGGMIVLEATTISVAGAVVANGGGGGGGGADNGDGDSGENGSITTMGANGGNGSGTTSADGGDGGARLFPMGRPPTELFNGGGGGGGGGVGFIVTNVTPVTASGAVISPAPQ